VGANALVLTSLQCFAATVALLTLRAHPHPVPAGAEGHKGSWESSQLAPKRPASTGAGGCALQ
jgi:hypothetical protein